MIDNPKTQLTQQHDTVKITGFKKGYSEPYLLVPNDGKFHSLAVIE